MFEWLFFNAGSLIFLHDDLRCVLNDLSDLLFTDFCYKSSEMNSISCCDWHGDYGRTLFTLSWDLGPYIRSILKKNVEVSYFLMILSFIILLRLVKSSSLVLPVRVLSFQAFYKYLFFLYINRIIFSHSRVS